MKRILLVVSLCMLASFSFAQKKAIREAKSAMRTNAGEARELITPALTNPETANEPDTWKVAGDIEYKVFDDERTKEMEKIATGKGGNEELMYTGLYNMYDPYIKADELSQVPDEKGKIKNKVRADIVKKFREGYHFLINGGIFYNDRKDFKRAADFFERYWTLPSHPMFADEKEPLVNPQDTTYQTIKYYAAISAVQSGDNDRSIKLLNKLKNETYVKNPTYEESAIYELLASEYKLISDSAAYANTLAEGAKKFPGNVFFTPNLINEYIRGGRTKDALEYIDQAIANDPKSCDLHSVKASLFAEQKKYEDAEPAYLAGLAVDENCERALEGLGVLYVLQAQDKKEQAGQTTNRKEQADLDKATADLYLKALPHLEKYLALLKARNADTTEVKPALMKLQNIYYNLSLLDVDKSKELEAIDKELGTSTN